MANIASVFSDGGCVGRNPSPVAGSWAYAYVDEHDELVGEGSGLVFPESLEHGQQVVTNNQSEFYALAQAFSGLPDGWTGRAFVDSQITLLRFSRMARTNGLPEWLVQQAARDRRRLGAVEYVLLKGHPTKADLARGYHEPSRRPVSKWNAYVDAACTAAAEAYRR